MLRTLSSIALDYKTYASDDSLLVLEEYAWVFDY